MLIVILFFFPTILPDEGLERCYSYDVSIQTFIKKAVFFSGGKNVGHVNVACKFGHDNDKCCLLKEAHNSFRTGF